MEIRAREHYTLDARQKPDWIDEVLEQVQRLYMTHARQPDEIEITPEQADDLMDRFPEAYGPGAGRPLTLWGVPLTVRKRP